MSDSVMPAVSLEPSSSDEIRDTNTDNDPQKKIVWGIVVFLVGILGVLTTFIGQYFPEDAFRYFAATGATIVTLASLGSFIALFQKEGRSFALWAMLIFSIASPVLLFIAFVSFNYRA